MSKWDDVRYFLAVARLGNLGQAASVLRVNATTVMRRLQAMEDAHRTPFFLKSGSSRTLTDAGRDILPYAERIEAEMKALSTNISTSDQRNSGLIKVSMPDGLAVGIMPTVMEALRERHPDISIRLIVANTPVDLLARDTDIELRPTREPSEKLKGRRVARIAFGIYVATNYLRAKGLSVSKLPPLQSIMTTSDWVMPDVETLSIYAPSDWMYSTIPRRNIVATVGSAVVMCSLVEQGLGVTVLPNYLGDRSPGLVRLHTLDRSLWGELWLLTHPDMSRVKRIRSFLDCTITVLRANPSLLEGGDRRPD